MFFETKLDKFLKKLENKGTLYGLSQLLNGNYKVQVEYDDYMLIWIYSKDKNTLLEEKRLGQNENDYLI